MQDADAQQGSDARRALKAVFRRLARVAIAAGVTAPVAYRLLKEAMVEAAEGDFALEDARATDSRISMLTGVHRKDVRAFRSADRPESEAGAEPLLATVIGRWLADPALRDADGAPRALPRQAGDQPSFDALVQAVTRDMRPRTVLDELVRRGAAEHDAARDQVTLKQHALIGADRGALHYLARNVGDHIAALAANMATPETPPHLERAVFYSGLSAESVQTLEALSRAEAAAMLERVNAEALRLQARDDAAPTAPERRFRLGVYFFDEAVKPSTSSGES